MPRERRFSPKIFWPNLEAFGNPSGWWTSTLLGHVYVCANILESCVGNEKISLKFSCIKFFWDPSGHWRPRLRVKDVGTKNFIFLRSEGWGGSFWVGTSAIYPPQKNFSFRLLFRSWLFSRVSRKRAEYCFESTVSEKGTHWASLSFGANSVSSAKNLVSSPLHTNARLKGTHWARSPELSEPRKNSLSSVFENRTLRNRTRPVSTPEGQRHTN